MENVLVFLCDIYYKTKHEIKPLNTNMNKSFYQCFLVRK